MNVWRVWAGRGDVRGVAVGLALCVGRRLRTLPVGVVGVHGAHHEGRGGCTSTTHTAGVARRIMRTLHPPLLAATCHVLLLGVDGRELRTLGVVGVARRIMRTLHPPLLAVTCHVLLLGVDGLGFRTLGVVGVHGAHREGRGGRTSTMGGARHAAERCEHEDQRVEAGVAATE